MSFRQGVILPPTSKWTPEKPTQIRFKQFNDLWNKSFFSINIKSCSIHICCLLESQWKWSIYQVSLVEYKVQLVPFTPWMSSKKSKWLFSLWDYIFLREIIREIWTLEWHQKYPFFLFYRDCWIFRNNSSFCSKFYD